MTRITRRNLLEASLGGLGSAVVASNAAARVPARPTAALRVGVVGVGLRGMAHMKALGYAENGNDVRAPEGVRIVAVCDTFKLHRLLAARVVGRAGEIPADYVDYREMLENEELDVVTIATPDFSHARIAIDAMRAGADVYVEKCMANTLAEALELRRVRAETGRIVQVGYQLHQDQMHRLAREYYQRGYIGEVHMVQSVLRRSGSQGGFLRSLARNGGPPREQIDWERFLMDAAPMREYEPERYFEWRKFWDYGTGISGDLLSHAADEAAMIMDLPAPTTCVSSGGLYHWKGNRETPDTFSASLEFPERDLQFNYSCVTSNSHTPQSMLLLGTEGTMAVSWKIEIFADRFSEKYAEAIESSQINPREPIVLIEDPAAARDQRAAPSELWLAGRGATWTTRGEQEFDTTFLHMDEFISSVRTREQPSASDESSFGSTLACHMATQSYLRERKVRWDAERELIV